LGFGEAFEVSKKAFEAIKRGSIFTLSGREAIKDLDCYLRDEKHARNPGTTADLTVSACFCFSLIPSVVEQFHRISGVGELHCC